MKNETLSIKLYEPSIASHDPDGTIYYHLQELVIPAYIKHTSLKDAKEAYKQAYEVIHDYLVSVHGKPAVEPATVIYIMTSSGAEIIDILAPMTEKNGVIITDSIRRKAGTIDYYRYAGDIASNIEAIEKGDKYPSRYTYVANGYVEDRLYDSLQADDYFEDDFADDIDRLNLTLEDTPDNNTEAGDLPLLNLDPNDLPF